MKIPNFTAEDFEVGIWAIGAVCIGILFNSICAGVLGFIGLRYICVVVRGY